MRQRTSIVLASILKPVDDTRMFEKFGLSLGQTNKYDVNIIGFTAKNLKKFDNIHFYPLFEFSRISFLRLLAPLRLLYYLFKVKPSIVIFNTPEILYVIALFKLISGCRIIYDIQENYFRNVYFNKNYLLPFRFLLAYAIRLKEWSARWFIDRLIFAEEGYRMEMPRSARRAVVIRNTYKDLEAAGLDYIKFGGDKDPGDINSKVQNTQTFNANTSSDENCLNTRALKRDRSNSDLGTDTGELNGGRSNHDHREDNREIDGGGSTYDHRSGARETDEGISTYDHRSGAMELNGSGDSRNKGSDAGGFHETGIDSENLSDPNLNNQKLYDPLSGDSVFDLRWQHKDRSVFQEPSYKKKISGPSETRDNPKSLTFLFSGTLSDNYGIFNAIDFIDAMHKLDPSYNLLIAGFCANEKIFRKLINRIENKPHIKLIGGSHRVPHQEIIQYIRFADFGMICYEINPSTENCFPTKIFEYMANQLPMIIQNYGPWASFCKRYNAGIEIDFHNFTPRKLSDSIKTESFYMQGPPEEVFWTEDEEKLLKLVGDIQS